MSRRASPRHPARGWLTLFVLLAAVAVLSLGPATLGEALSGLIFARPRAATLPAFSEHFEPILQARLESVAGSPAYGRVSASVVDLQTGATASLDADRAFPAASLFKLPILVEVLAEEDAGQLDPTAQLEIRAEDWTDGSGVLQARVGDRLAVRELTRLMIQESDNIAARVLLDAVGVPAVNAIDERLGLHTTRLVDHRTVSGAEHTTSASDMAHLLVGLATGQLVNQHVSEEALRLLELKQATTWLGDDLPFWVKVAHKWGDLPQARNDVGAVFTPRGSYVVAVLTEDGTPDESARIIARTSRMAYDYLGGRPALIASNGPRSADQPVG
ncbi:MAG: class A beta-lactamase-related serine hydrolase [Chloroflexota bacterium]|nr:class A beta-lactamase-related serine hydrolase [Chloroflexota bacterium]